MRTIKVALSAMVVCCFCLSANAKEESIASVIHNENGKSALVIDGKPEYAAYMWANSLGTKEFPSAPAAAEFAKAGIHNYAFDIGHDEWCGPKEGRSTGNIPQDHFDFSEFKNRLSRIIEVDPKARFHFRVYLEKLGPDNWWVKMYPDELELTQNSQSTGDDKPQAAPMFQPTQSLASVVWRQQAKAYLSALVRHIKEIGMTDRVIAYQIGYGYCQETFKWSAVGPDIGDFSKPMQTHFRKWLKDYYKDDVNALKKAWATDDITFETASVPSMKAQLNTTGGTFRDPAKEQSVIDYYRCFAELDADLFIDFCRTVKEANGEAALTGGFYGYIYDRTDSASFWQAGSENHLSGLQRSGHLGLKKVLNSPYIDFLVSPYTYFFRGIGGECSAMMPTESLRIHNKMYILEDDTRTFLNPDDRTCGRTFTLDDTTAVLQRNFAQSLTRRWGTWWLGVRGSINPAKEPAFIPLLRQIQELGRWALQFDSKPSAEIAILLDEESMLYGNIHNDLYLPLTTNQRIWGLPRIGAPADYYLLDDLIEGRIPPAKLYIFLNAFKLDTKRRDALAKQLRKDGRTALWIYAPGYIKGSESSMANMTELTGFTFGKSEFAWGPKMHITNFAHPITKGLAEDMFWGTTNPIGPVFYLEDKDAIELGGVVHTQGLCMPGFGLKEYGNWNSVFIAVPDIPAPVLRGIARYAGVHLYSDAGDVLYASSEFVAIHTKGGGRRTIRLPKKVEAVYNLYACKQVATDVSQFTVELKPRSTTLYYFGDAKPLSGLRSQESGSQKGK